MPDRWYPLTIQQTTTADGFIVVLTTDVPCHLWLYWTFKVPWTHRTSAVHRGLNVPWDAYWCFVAWQKIEQDEDGDTTTHTFNWTGWEVCQTRYFRFHGTVDGQDSPSDTAILHKHYTYTPPPWTLLRSEPWTSDIDIPANWECYWIPRHSLQNFGMYWKRRTDRFISPPSSLRIGGWQGTVIYYRGVFLRTDVTPESLCVPDGKILTWAWGGTYNDPHILLGYANALYPPIIFALREARSAWQYFQIIWEQTFDGAGDPKTKVTIERQVADEWVLRDTHWFDPLDGPILRPGIATNCVSQAPPYTWWDDTEFWKKG
ncbi:hypothetical protein ES703_45200 [subsurface metagenome]